MGSIGAKTAMIASTEYFTIVMAVLNPLVEEAYCARAGGLDVSVALAAGQMVVAGGTDTPQGVSVCRTIEDNSPSYCVYNDVLHKLWGDHENVLLISTCSWCGVFPWQGVSLQHHLAAFPCGTSDLFMGIVGSGCPRR